MHDWGRALFMGSDGYSESLFNGRRPSPPVFATRKRAIVPVPLCRAGCYPISIRFGITLRLHVRLTPQALEGSFRP